MGSSKAERQERLREGANFTWRRSLEARDHCKLGLERNFLYDHLGLGEDGERGLRLEPDCADLPYFLRAYFAWKLGLPFGWSECSRGDGGRPPRCGRWHSNVETTGGGGDALARMQRYLLRDVAWGVQSGAGTLGDVLARTERFEVAYDPNDCIEVRWGAPPDSEEIATCRRHAPADQLARLARYRAWFRDRVRPPR